MDENFLYGGSMKNPIFGRGIHEKSIYRGELPKKGRGKRGGGVLEGVIPQCTLLLVDYTCRLNDFDCL